jgi:hypothetical protein
VLIYIHKELMLDAVRQRYPARRYVMVDDKPRILSAMKAGWGERLTTVFPRQGQYALAPQAFAGHPAPDVTIERIAIEMRQCRARRSPSLRHSDIDKELSWPHDSALSPASRPPPDSLVDVDALIAAYLAERPDPAVATERVAFGTSGHRGCAFERSFNEWHVLAISQAICDYRRPRASTGRSSSASTRTRCRRPLRPARSRCWPPTASR